MGNEYFTGYIYHVAEYASFWCNAFRPGARPVDIESKEEQEFVITELKRADVSLYNSLWIGLTSESVNRSKWKDGHDLTYTNWAPGEPRIYKRDVDWGFPGVVINTTSGEWYSKPNDYKTYSLCQIQTCKLGRAIRNIAFKHFVYFCSATRRYLILGKSVRCGIFEAYVH